MPGAQGLGIMLKLPLPRALGPGPRAGASVAILALRLYKYLLSDYWAHCDALKVHLPHSSPAMSAASIGSGSDTFDGVTPRVTRVTPSGLPSAASGLPAAASGLGLPSAASGLPAAASGGLPAAATSGLPGDDISDDDAMDAEAFAEGAAYARKFIEDAASGLGLPSAASGLPAAASGGLPAQILAQIRCGCQQMAASRSGDEWLPADPGSDPVLADPVSPASPPLLPIDPDPIEPASPQTPQSELTLQMGPETPTSLDSSLANTIVDATVPAPGTQVARALRVDRIRTRSPRSRPRLRRSNQCDPITLIQYQCEATEDMIFDHLIWCTTNDPARVAPFIAQVRNYLMHIEAAVMAVDGAMEAASGLPAAASGGLPAAATSGLPAAASGLGPAVGGEWLAGGGGPRH